jgi:hypothetical protein
MINAASIATSGTKVFFNNMKATVRVLGANELAFQFDSLKMPTKIMDIRDAEAEMGKTIVIRNPKADSPIYPAQLSVPEQNAKDKMQHYLDELNIQAGPGGVGGIKLRENVIKKTSEALGDQSPTSPATLARWQDVDKTQTIGITHSLLRGRNMTRASQYEASGIYGIAFECIDDYYLVKNQPPIKAAYKKFKERVAKEFGAVKVPSRQTFTSWIDSICALTKLIKKNGKRYAKAFRRNAVKEILTERPLQRVEADGLHLAIGIVDEDGNYLGRVILLFVFDAHTRCVLGYKVIVARGESSSAIIDSYRHALLPKTVGPLCKNTYPMYGVFESIFTDGGKGYLGRNPNAFLLLAGIKQDVAQSYSGWMKPFVERFNGTVRTQFAKELDSYCGRLGDDRCNELTIQQKATLTLPEFEELFEKWIVDKYHQTRHSKLLCTPHEKWTNYYQNRSPMLPGNMAYLSLPAGETRIATISGDASHLGVQINNLRYNDADGQLKNIGMQLKDMGQEAKVECHYSETNVFEILVINPFDGAEFVAETCSNDVVDGMSLVEYKALIKSREAESNGSVPDSDYDELVTRANTKTRKKTKNKDVKKQAVAKPSDIEKTIKVMFKEQQNAVDLDKAKHIEQEAEPELEPETETKTEEETYDEI